jgi:PKD repeat protein
VIEALPSLTNKRIIPLGLNANQIGEHTIKLNKVDQLDETSLIVLEDRLLGVFHNLRASNYVFNTTEAIEGLGRFYLHVSASIKLETQAPTCENAVGSLTIDVPSTDVWNASLLNQNGVLLSNFVAESNYTINDLTSGNYTLSLTNTFGETFNKSFEIDGIETVAVNLTVNQNSAFINENLIFEANAENANHFEFNFGNGDVVNSNEPVVFYSYPTAGNYEVTVKAFSYDCEATSTQTVEVLNSALSVQTVDQTKLVVMPNPANDVVTIVLPSVTAQATLILLDAKGSVVLKEVMNNQASTTISTQNLANGIYQIQLITNKQNIQSKLVVVH